MGTAAINFKNLGKVAVRGNSCYDVYIDESGSDLALVGLSSIVLL